jgi:protein SCO1/2
MTFSIDRRAFVAGTSSLLLTSGSAIAGAAVPAARFPIRLHEMPVLDARSRRRGLLIRDFMRDRVTVLNFMFTGCSTICPMQAALLSAAQRLLAREMDARVVFTSVSIAPLTDTPEALVRFADAHRAGRGWHFLRGALDETQRFQEGVDSLAPRVEDHPPVIAIGRAGAPRWSRLYGAPAPDLIAGEARKWLVPA